MLATLPVSVAGYAAIANVGGTATAEAEAAATGSARVRFAMTCLMAIGMYGSVPCILVWNANNSAGHYKRATTSALQLAVANCGGFVASKCPAPASPSDLGQHFFSWATRLPLIISRTCMPPMPDVCLCVSMLTAGRRRCRLCFVLQRLCTPAMRVRCTTRAIQSCYGYWSMRGSRTSSHFFARLEV